MIQTKKIFYAFNVHAPWPDHYPKAKVLEVDHRHMTLCFLGSVEIAMIKKLQDFPMPSFSIGPSGYFDQCIALPKENPSVVAWKVAWLSLDKQVLDYQKQLSDWIKGVGCKIHEYPSWLAHVTIARNPNSFEEFQKAFRLLPFYIDEINLYESLGNSKYDALYCKSLLPPIEKMAHTADIAYFIYGQDYEQIYLHAKLALTFEMPEVIELKDNQNSSFSCIEHVVVALNHIVTEIDITYGAGIKAVSFHGKMQKIDNYLKWEMIIDV